MAAKGQFVCYKTAKGYWNYRLKASNKETIAVSGGTGYSSFSACKAGIESVRKNSGAKIEDQTLQKFETLKKGLIKCRDYIFNFLEDPMIPSDNNGSERGIRKLKIKLKNSCTFRSDLGADAFLELHSIIETAKKHNKTPFNAIQALFEV